MTRQINTGILSLFFLVFCIFSCKKKQEEPLPKNGEDITIPKGRLYMHLHNYIEDLEVDAYNIPYATSEGRKISLTMAQLYLSNFELIKLDGSIIPLPGTIVLKEQSNLHYLIADVPAGNYKTVRFNIGLDPGTNQKNPEPDVSVLNRAEMWFGSAAQPEGFIFANIQGKIDTTTDASASVEEMQSFTYKIGTNTNYVQRTMPDQNFTIVPDQAFSSHLYINYSKLFEGINLSNPENLKVENAADNSKEIARRIAANIPSMFFYEF